MTLRCSERMKAYEDRWRAALPPKSYAILRVDGRAFHTLTRHMDRPFDEGFIAAMNCAAQSLCAEIQGAQFAYVQSDEVSVLLTDFGATAQPWFGGVVQKMCSVAASIASVTFSGEISRHYDDSVGVFDARVFTVPTRDEAINYFLHRQADCHRNAVSMVAEACFSSRQLHGKTVASRLEMLAERGVVFASYTLGARHGRVVVKVAEEGPVTYTRRDTGEQLTEVVTRHRWEVQPAPWFDYDEAGFLEINVPRFEVME